MAEDYIQPNYLICPITGQKYGTRSLRFHLKWALKKWDEQNKSDPKLVAQGPKFPDLLEKVVNVDFIPKELQDAYNAEALKCYEENKVIKPKTFEERFQMSRSKSRSKASAKKKTTANTEEIEGSDNKLSANGTYDENGNFFPNFVISGYNPNLPSSEHVQVREKPPIEDVSPIRGIEDGNIIQQETVQLSDEEILVQQNHHPEVKHYYDPETNQVFRLPFNVGKQSNAEVRTKIPYFNRNEEYHTKTVVKADFTRDPPEYSKVSMPLKTPTKQYSAEKNEITIKPPQIQPASEEYNRYPPIVINKNYNCVNQFSPEKHKHYHEKRYHRRSRRRREPREHKSKSRPKTYLQKVDDDYVDIYHIATQTGQEQVEQFMERTPQRNEEVYNPNDERPLPTMSHRNMDNESLQMTGRTSPQKSARRKGSMIKERSPQKN